MLCYNHSMYTGGNVWCDIAKYIVKWTQEKWACDSHDDATPLSFQLQVTEDFFKISYLFQNEKMTRFSKILGQS